MSVAADVLLWRNKKISAGVLAGATAIWVLFEWLNYNFSPTRMLCFGAWYDCSVCFGQMLQIQIHSNVSPSLETGLHPKSLVLFYLMSYSFNVAKSVGAEVNRALGFLQDVACGGNIKQFVIVVASLWIAAMVGCWCNFLTVLYIGFVAAHTLPVLYERYDDQVDGFVYNVLGQLQHHYRKLDSGVLSKIPKGKLRGKKHE
ncbi:reticulon family protein [Actinidia rufa]|uniref:Reticulon-like protein n=1 Tax=Actinidia rufa TaxID=165716 RepID=A0A7J0DFA1_9ERIC|nr:reticulon family protein [Actinidia rufa]